MLSNKNAFILQLKQQILNHVSENKSAKKKQTSEARVNTNRTQFLAKVSHELRTPVNGIAGIAGLLHDTDLTLDQRKLITLIEKSSQSLSTLIDDLLDYTKIDAGALKLEKIEFELEETVRECVDLLGINAQEKSLEFGFQLAEELPTIIVGDPLRLRQILINLAGNAIKFTHQGTVNIIAEPLEMGYDDLTIRFQVKDSGIGIPENRLKNLFGYYTQADSSTARKYGGTGLGLAITKELVQLMGGQIGVESSEGVGSTFWFTARFRQNTSTKNVPSQEKPRVRKLMNDDRKDLRILLVEDDYITRKVSSMLLKRSGQEHVDFADDGLKAIQKLQQSHYDIVLMDMQMPEMDGVEACRLIRQTDSGVLDPNVPIIAMTANTLEDDRDKCLSAGMNGFISKPLDADELNQTIQQLISLTDTTFGISNPDSQDELSTIDHEKLSQVKQDMGDKFKPLVQLFLTHLPEKLLSIQSCIASDNPEKMKAAAHKLRGNCASFYAEKMANLCDRIEQSEAENYILVSNLLSLLESEALRVIDTLKSVIQDG